MTDLKKLLDEATPGPWHHGGSPVDNPYRVDVVKFYAGGMGAVIADMRGEPEKRTHDAALIVAAVNAVPELLALRDEVGRLREALAILDAADEFDGEPDNKKLFVAMRVADLRRARAALNQEPGQ